MREENSHIRLPPLNTLPDFEAAGRHLSFTLAAAEMNVTHGAVSRQVKALEQYLGVKLFRRLTRRLVLTDEGQAYLPAVRRLLDGLAEETRRLKRRDRTGHLTVSTNVSFGTKWLAARLVRFQAIEPGIDVNLNVTDTLVDFARDDVDIAIRYGFGDYPGVIAERLFAEHVVPVCSPALRRRLRRPEDLRHHVLLHESRMGANWHAWLGQMGITGVDAGRGPIFSHGSMMIEAAINGEGVALGRSVLIAEDLAARRLVRPFGNATLQAERRYDLVYPPGALERPKVAAFRNWLLGEVARAGLA
ncbi:MAG: transcriptional regulator GcvA [Ferrovibrionaceae bacterium]